MSLQQKLTTQMNEGMKSGDTERVSVIRMLRSSIKNKEIENRTATAAPLTDEDILKLIATGIKQRKEAISLFQQGGRTDLAEKEAREVAILESFLPPPFSEDELKAEVQEAIRTVGANGIKQMGKVMKQLAPRIAGRADGKKTSELVRACLGGAATARGPAPAGGATTSERSGPLAR